MIGNQRNYTFPKVVLFLFIGACVLSVLAFVSLTIGATYLQNADIRGFRDQHELNDSISIDRFVVNQFKAGMSREEVHATMRVIGPTTFYRYEPSYLIEGEHIELMDLRIGRFTNYTYIACYDAAGGLIRVVAED
jgi:hypothetical protein